MEFTLMDVVVPALVSLLTALLAIKWDRSKLKTTLREEYTKQVFSRRIEHYPKLFKLLSDLGKVARFEGLDVTHLSKFWGDMNEWDSAYSIFLSPYSATQINNVRNKIFEIMRSDSIDSNTCDELAGILFSLEEILKTELGIMELDDFHSPHGQNSFNLISITKKKAATD